MNEKETFLRGNSTANENLHLNDDAKIKAILAEQEKLQHLYNEVVAYIQQHSQMLPDEMIKYQTQLKQLSEYYQKNQEKLKTLGYSHVQVNKNVVIKTGAKKNVSLKTIFFGCAAVIFVFVLGLSILSFYLASNPEKLGGFGSLGIQPAVAVSILKGLSLTVMLVILLLGIVILIMNVYKSFTVKNKPKGWYYAGIVLGIIVLSIGLGAGSSLLSNVGKIDVASLANPDDVVIPYMHITNPDGKNSNILIDGTFPLIAPVNVPFSLALDNYKKFMDVKLGGQHIESQRLDCGNGQILNYSMKDHTIEGACFYMKKGTYPINLIVDHITIANERKTTSFLLKNLVVGSELKINAMDKKVSSGVNELVVGPLPAKIEFNADQIFRDFNLKNYEIVWDGDNDGAADKINDTTFVFSYDISKVYFPRVSFPAFGNQSYTFPLRVEQSGVPVCHIDLEEKTVNDYKLTASFFDGAERFISDYSFLFYDKATGKLIDEIHDTDLGFNFDYRFPGKGTYVVQMNFIAVDGKESSCKTEAKLIEKSTFDVLYEFYASSPNDVTYKKLDTNFISDKKLIPLSEVPTKLKLKLLKIEPKTFNTRISVFLDGKPIVFTTEGEYLFDIRDAHEHTIEIQIQDKVRGLDYKETLVTKIGLEDIIGKMSVLGDPVGFEPFEVTLDASSSRVNDPHDQITYFSWDFGDGTKQEKVSNGVIKHKYRFDYENNRGEYVPSVTIYTQKGRSITVKLGTALIVKKQLIKLDIIPTSHPTQEARINDSITFSLDFNGLPKKVSWDFGDGEPPLECEGRNCTEMTKSWSKKGKYLIKVTMDFEDQQSVEQTMQFMVRE